jgi:Tfp pilus assembly protein PilX
VIAYAIAMVIYMITFLVLAIMTIQTPHFITSQCNSINNSDYNITSGAAKDALCKNECECYFTNNQGYSDACKLITI